METDPMTEIEQLRAEVAELRKALSNKQQLAAPKSLPALHDNLEFVTDMTRFAEGLEGYSEKNLRKKWKFTEEIWEQLSKDDQLCERIEAEKLRRVRDGSLKREKAQQHIVRGPDILNEIMSDKSKATSPKHVIDAIKCLDSLTGDTPRAAHNDSERVIVTITLSADEKLTFDKPIRVDPNPNDKIIDVTPPVPGFAITEG